MDIKMKCTQCGCEDLEEVDFPYEANLIETESGISPEAARYELENKLYTSTYICTRCGHFEFFNPEFAQLIIKDRQEKAALQSEIDKIDAQILENIKESDRITNNIEKIAVQLNDLDITIRQSNELKAQQESLKEKKQSLQHENKALEKHKKLLKNKIQEI